MKVRRRGQRTTKTADDEDDNRRRRRMTSTDKDSWAWGRRTIRSRFDKNTDVGWRPWMILTADDKDDNRWRWRRIRTVDDEDGGGGWWWLLLLNKYWLRWHSHDDDRRCETAIKPYNFHILCPICHINILNFHVWYKSYNCTLIFT